MKSPGVVIDKENKQILVKNGGQYVRVHPWQLHLENQYEKYSSHQNIGPDENAEDQKNNSAPWENYLNYYLNINANQLPENDNDEKIISVKCKKVVNNINELPKSIIK